MKLPFGNCEIVATSDIVAADPNELKRSFAGGLIRLQLRSKDADVESLRRRTRAKYSSRLNTPPGCHRNPVYASEVSREASTKMKKKCLR